MQSWAGNKKISNLGTKPLSKAPTYTPKKFNIDNDKNNNNNNNSNNNNNNNNINFLFLCTSAQLGLNGCCVEKIKTQIIKFSFWITET